MFLKLGCDPCYICISLYVNVEATRQSRSAFPGLSPRFAHCSERSTDLNFRMHGVARLEARFENCSSRFLDRLS